jgi:NTE family protein
MKKLYKTGITLSGGGARGIAHIGVLDALLENGIEPDIISGTSAGSIIGALYAAGKTPVEMLDFVKESSIFKVFRVGLPDKGLASLKYLSERLEGVIPDDSFEALHKPLFVAITNLLSGKLEVRNSGELYRVIMASSAIPLIFQPIDINNSLFVDGGALENLPVRPIKQQCQAVIGVNVMPLEPVQQKSVNSMVGVAMRCFEMVIAANTRPDLRRCDVVIEPAKVRDYNIFQFQKYKDLYEIGYVTTMMHMPDIKAQLRPQESLKK